MLMSNDDWISFGDKEINRRVLTYFKMLLSSCASEGDVIGRDRLDLG